jgi:hypothetical protein
MWIVKNSYNVLVGKPECKRALERPRGRSDCNNKKHLKEICEMREGIGVIWLS